jgi:hypothetical protein
MLDANVCSTDSGAAAAAASAVSAGFGATSVGTPVH